MDAWGISWQNWGKKLKHRVYAIWSMVLLYSWCTFPNAVTTYFLAFFSLLGHQFTTEAYSCENMAMKLALLPTNGPFMPFKGWLSTFRSIFSKRLQFYLEVARWKQASRNVLQKHPSFTKPLYSSCMWRSTGWELTITLGQDCATITPTIFQFGLQSWQEDPSSDIVFHIQERKAWDDHGARPDP